MNAVQRHNSYGENTAEEYARIQQTQQYTYVPFQLWATTYNRSTNIKNITQKCGDDEQRR